jgi:hypothetical protein
MRECGLNILNTNQLYFDTLTHCPENYLTTGNFILFLCNSQINHPKCGKFRLKFL